MSITAGKHTHQLIIVEGLPCSGKSTTAKYIAEKLNMKCFDENSGLHPAEYEFEAFVKNSDMCGFSDDEQKTMLAASFPRPDGYIIPLGKLDGNLFEKLLPYKIYDSLPWETEKPLMLDKWREFANGTAPTDGYVFNCVLLQNPMCETMIRFGFDKALSLEYIGEICGIIKSLSPLAVYLKNNNIRDSIMQAVPERGEEWLNSVIEYHCKGEYGKRHKLSGFEGYIAALEERQRRELEILKNLDIEYTVLDDPYKDWEGSRLKIINRLI